MLRSPLPVTTSVLLATSFSLVSTPTLGTRPTEVAVERTGVASTMRGANDSSMPGDTAEKPFTIPALPFEGIGNTCGFANDYDEMCPYGGMGPDVVYAYLSTDDRVVNISLCDSHYDTKILVYENMITPGQPYACNDDRCTGPNYPYPYLSYVFDLPLVAGTTYLIVVDGYGSECGEYLLRIVDSASCELVCPEGADEEGEPKCRLGYVDVHNGGCESEPPVFQTFPPGADPFTLCCFSGTFGSHPWHDEDWYEISPADTSEIALHVKADFPVFVSVLDGTQGCEAETAIAHATAEPCEPFSLILTLGEGTYWIRVRPLVGGGIPCSAKYVMTIEGHQGPVTAVPRPGESTSEFDLQPGFPNPFTDDVTIRCHLAVGGRVSLDVHDVSGRRVRTLLDRHLPAGAHTVLWDARNDTGAPVPSGIYFYRLEAAGHVKTTKVVRVSR
jgi:hypothetical protein